MLVPFGPSPALFFRLCDIGIAFLYLVADNLTGW
jgi:hypothetical protein